MNLDGEILGALAERPLSGGKLIERFQAADPGALAGQAVLVYGALARLRAAGRVHVISGTQGEVVFGVEEDAAAMPAQPGFPPSFALGPAELALAEKGVYERTKGLPPHYFEELRRVVVADADRRVFNGAKLPLAVTEALADLGPVAGVRRFLARVEKGRPPPGIPRPRRRWPYFALGAVALLLALYYFVFDLHTIPPQSMSMAPALFPAAEGGDQAVLVLRYAQWFDLPSPDRGDLVVFDLPGAPEPLVKRVWGLPGETIRIEKGDLVVNGERFVKERALLDRVRVPLLDLADFEERDRTWTQQRPVVVGYRRPDGELEVARSGPCGDVVVRLRLRWSGKGSVTIALGRYLVLVTHEKYDVAERGVSVASGRARIGGETEVWITNADRSFRVEVGGVERVRVPAATGIREPEVSATLDGEVEMVGIEVARDLVFDRTGGETDTRAAGWKIGADQVFVLGDNSVQSRDSRTFGPIDAAVLRGRVLAVIWPWGRLRRLR